MRFLNLYDDTILTLVDVWRDWKEFKEEDPINHADNFKRELFDIIDATLRGRNDFDIIGMTGPEVLRFYTKLMQEV